MLLIRSLLQKFVGIVLTIGGAGMFGYGLLTFAATKGQSLEGFGAVLLGYGGMLIGVYVHPGFRSGIENAVSALRRIADRFFDV